MYKMPIHFMKTYFIDLDPEIKQFKELCLEMSQERRLTCHFFFVKKFKNNNSNQSWTFELTKKKNGY